MRRKLGSESDVQRCSTVDVTLLVATWREDLGCSASIRREVQR